MIFSVRPELDRASPAVSLETSLCQGSSYGRSCSTSSSWFAPVRHYRASDPALVSIAHERVGAAEAYARTGVTEMAINTCFQLMRDAHAGLLAGRPTMLLTPDLWTYWLTGSLGAERTIASTTGLLDQQTGDWANGRDKPGGLSDGTALSQHGL